MAAKGSTAPAITSPLLAWPARPTPRSTPLVTPSTSTFETFDFPSRTDETVSHKGKARADGDDMDDEHSGQGGRVRERTYRPPQKPLSPQQLGRIAQSFGIEVPSLPTPPPSGSQASPARSVTPTSAALSTRSSSCLLTVIPPISLLPPSTSAASQEGLKRWRRGRLIPLQPTIGSMLLAIAREYGLPSTKGINLYIVNSQQRSSASSASDLSEEPGPRISSSTWTSLFASQVASVSRTSTPTGSPQRLGTLLNRDRLPHSPLSPFSDIMPNRAGHLPNHSFLPTPTKPFSRDSTLPLTPTSTGTPISASSPVIATIEFDVDPEEASWLASFQMSGRRRNLSTASEGGGVRQLRLLARTNDDRPRFLKELDINAYPDNYTPTSEEGSFAIKSPDETDDSIDFSEVSVQDGTSDELLAPLELNKDMMLALDKRGSGIVMSEQLDDLERVMRQLSPKEIRLTSPRVLTPRMAAKVAHLQFPPPPVPRIPARPAKSPLVNSFTDPSDTEAMPKVENGKYTTPDPSLGRSAWPAVPYAKSTESPGSPQIDEYFKPPTRPTGDMSRKSSFSDETMRRMAAEKEQEDSVKPLSSEWKPRRPARPPSPNLQAHSHNRNLSHTLSPELVNTLRSPPMTSPRSPDEEGRKAKQRSNSISLKGLRASMSSKNLNVNWRKDEHREPLPAAKAEPHGLFGHPIESSSSFPGLDTRQSAHPAISPALSEFGSVDLNSPNPEVNGTASLPSKQQQQSSTGMRRLFGGSLPFKGRTSTDSHRSSLKSRRHPSQDGTFAISPPIPESFHKVENGLTTNPAHATVPAPPSFSPPRRQPGSPSSPHALRRKPVPGAGGAVEVIDINGANGQAGIPGSVSFGSVASFVLEDPPKRRARGQGEYR